MKFIARIVSTALALMLVTYVVPGITVDSLQTAFLVAFTLGILNAVIRPVLVVLTLPITILTLGVFFFVINAGIFMFVASFVSGFQVTSFLSALSGSLFVSVVSSIAYRYM